MGFEPRQYLSWLETINKFMEWIKMAVEETKFTIWKAQGDMA